MKRSPVETIAYIVDWKPCIHCRNDSSLSKCYKEQKKNDSTKQPVTTQQAPVETGEGFHQELSYISPRRFRALSPDFHTISDSSCFLLQGCKNRFDRNATSLLTLDTFCNFRQGRSQRRRRWLRCLK